MSGEGTGMRRRRVLGAASVVGVLLLIAGFMVITVVHGDRELTRVRAAAPSPPAVGAGGLSVVGDSVSAGSESWPQLAAASVGRPLFVQAAPDAAYLPPPGGPSFSALARKIDAHSSVVVFVGGAGNRSASALQWLKASTLAFSNASRIAPKARLIVVGPLANAGSATLVASARDALRRAAAIAGVTWIDPVKEGWLSQAGSTRGGSVTAKGQRELARRIAAAMK